MTSTTTRHDETLTSTAIASPLGALTLVADPRALVGLYFEAHRPAPRVRGARVGSSRVLAQAARELEAYFARPAHRFQLALAPHGTAFERAVWAALREIPVGEVRTYGALARALGRPSAARAVGGAVARNPLSIVVPCHRVVGADGSLTGFAGGLPRKAWLLARERRAGSLSCRDQPSCELPSDSSPY